MERVGEKKIRETGNASRIKKNVTVPYKTIHTYLSFSRFVTAQPQI